MMMTIEKWMPDIGVCEWSQWNNGMWVPVTVHGLSDKMAIISEANGKQFAVYLDTHGFRPAKSEAEKARDEQINIIVELLEAIGAGKKHYKAEALYNSGCRILKEGESIAPAGTVAVKPLTQKQKDYLYAVWNDGETAKWLIDAVQRELGLAQREV